MKNDKNDIGQMNDIAQVIITFHKKVKQLLKGKSMIDGYSVTIRDAIEAVGFINYFRDLLGLAQAMILGISRQYISKLKNEDKPEIIAALKEVDFSGFVDTDESVSIDDILYLGGKSDHLKLANVLSGGVSDQLGNLFYILTLHAPKSMQKEIDILHRMLMSDDTRVLAAAIRTLSFLPDEVKKVIIKFGIDIYCDNRDIFYELMMLASGIDDNLWKQQIIENELLPIVWNDTNDTNRDMRIDTIAALSAGISDESWKKTIVYDLLLQKLSSNNINIRAAAAGTIWALSGTLGCEEWKKEIIQNALLPLTSDNSGLVASWSVKAIGSLSTGLNDIDWEQKMVKDCLQPRFFHKSERVRIAAVAAVGTLLAEIKDDIFRKSIVAEYLSEKLFDKPSVQFQVVRSLKEIFAAIDDEEWKQGTVENYLLPKLMGRREDQTVIISGIEGLFVHIKSEEWKKSIIENNFLPRLRSRDWYIHSETLKMLGTLNRSIADQEWKQRIVEEYLVRRLVSDDKDIQSSAAMAIGMLSKGNISEQWQKEILEDHILPKVLNEDDKNVRTSLLGTISVITAGIGNEEWRQGIINEYLLDGFNGDEDIAPMSAEATCEAIKYPLYKKDCEVDNIFLKNLEEYLSEDTPFSFMEGSYDDAITETNGNVTIGRFTIKKNAESSPHVPDKVESALVNTKTTIEDVEYLAASVLIDKPVLEIGPTATRKSTLIQYLASLTETPYRRFNLNGQTDKYEFIGGYKPQTVTVSLLEAKAVIKRTIEDCEYETVVSSVTRLTGEKYSKEDAVRFVEDALKQDDHYKLLNIATLLMDLESQLEWQDGILIEAIKNGYYLNLDELNLSETEVLERINSLLDDEESIVVYEHENEKYIKEKVYEGHINNYLQLHKEKSRQDAVNYFTSQGVYKIHTNFRLFATMNPKEYKGRNKLSDPFLNRWRILRIEELPDEELVEIMKVKYQISYELVIPVVLFHQSIREQAEKGVLGKQQREEYHFTIRDLIRVFERTRLEIKAYQESDHGAEPDTEEIKKYLALSVEEVYGMVFRDVDDQKKYGDFYRKTFGAISIPEEDLSSKQNRDRYIRVNNSGKIVVGQNSCIELSVFNNNQSLHIPGEKSILAHVKTTLQYIKTIARSLGMNEAIHLVGPTASAKTSIIRYIAYLTNTGFQRVSLAGQTDTADIIGQYQSTEIKGHYAWQDGTLLQAMNSGDYLLLDELNLAEPQILERLNSLLDTGRIVISEHNSETYIKCDLFDKMVSEKKIDENDKSFLRIHENFRIIAASNPVDIRHQGRTRLSLAFRNRFREVWMEEIEDQEELTEIVTNLLSNVE